MRPWLAGLPIAVMLVVPPGCGLGEEQTQTASQPVRCSSTPKDPNDVGLRGTALRTVDDGIEVTWTTSRPMGEFTDYSVALTDGDGFMRRELSLFFVGDELAEAFGAAHLAAIHDLHDGDTTFPDGEPEVEGSSVTMVFPRSAVERDGEPFGWYAGISVGEKEDWCPDARADESWPKSLELPE